MNETTAQEKRLRQSDVATAAMLLLQAVERAENTTIPTAVQTAYGEVEMTIDDTGADVVVSRGDRSVHVR
jgi:hypothetical protein